MRTIKDYTLNYRNYGSITVPRGTRVTHRTACGYDEQYNFVDEFGWIDANYPTIADLLKHDASYYGIDVPAEYINEAN